MLDSARRRQLQKDNLLALLRNGAFQFADERRPWFPYTSGQIGPYYVQSIAVERDGAAYAAAVDAVVELIRAEFPGADTISGGETRDWDFSNPAAVALRLPHVKLYKDGKTLGADIRGRRLLHVADLNNEGSSVRDFWKPIVEKNGGTLAGVVFYVDRLEEGTDVMRDLVLPAQAVVPLDEAAWTEARKEGFVSESLYASLLARLRDRHAWARQALVNHPDTFLELYRPSATRSKAEKIMRTYPDLKDFFARLLKDAGAA
jgi:orotate phosphoribosyltransferase